MFEISPASRQDEEWVRDSYLQMWLDNNVLESELLENWKEEYNRFIFYAKKKLHYIAIVAKSDGELLGAAHCQIFDGLFPRITKTSLSNRGYIWGVFVRGESRSQGIGEALTRGCLRHLKAVHCSEVVLHTSPYGEELYKKLGFKHSTELILEM